MSKTKKRILFVDDEEMVIDVGSQMLDILGYEVETTMSGRGAVEKYKEMAGEVDLVILDMIMPGMSGYETFEALKQIDDRVKVILSTGYTLDQNSRTMLQRGCVDFLQKPFDLDSLSAKIKQALDEPRR